MNAKLRIFWLLVSAALGGMRLYGIKSAAFQAVAHIVLGILIGTSFVGRSWFYAGLWIGLTVVEGAAAFALG